MIIKIKHAILGRGAFFISKYNEKSGFLRLVLKGKNAEGFKIPAVLILVVQRKAVRLSSTYLMERYLLLLNYCTREYR